MRCTMCHVFIPGLKKFNNLVHHTPCDLNNYICLSKTTNFQTQRPNNPIAQKLQWNKFLFIHRSSHVYPNALKLYIDVLIPPNTFKPVLTTVQNFQDKLITNSMQFKNKMHNINGFIFEVNYTSIWCAQIHAFLCPFTVKYLDLLPQSRHHQIQNHKQGCHQIQKLRITYHIGHHHRELAAFLLCQNPTDEDSGICKRKNYYSQITT